MNRLILIGNGFDLAHGMKTSYKDFVISYLKNCFSEARLKGEFEDDLILVVRNSQIMMHEVIDETVLDLLSKVPYSRLNQSDLKDKMSRAISLRTHPGFPILFSFKHKFIASIFSSVGNKRWVDIEIEYFKSLISQPHSHDHAISSLNNIFEILKSYLINYLGQLPIPHINNLILNVIGSGIDELAEKASNYSSRKNFPPQRLFLLNFNYTDLGNRYNDEMRKNGVNFESIQIHGNLSNSDNPIIFGYGDEMSDEYKTIELHESKEWLRFFKSFGYGLKGSYHKMLDFIEVGPFEIFVLGHSCGLSDRVMLNTLFEHPNCKLIRIYYHRRTDNSTDFMDVYQNIARQFSLNKRSDFRKKVLSLEVSKEFPQSI